MPYEISLPYRLLSKHRARYAAKRHWSVCDRSAKHQSVFHRKLINVWDHPDKLSPFGPYLVSFIMPANSLPWNKPRKKL